MKTDENETPSDDKDPVSYAAGSHPLGAGIGAAGGALTGAALGAALGPAGAVTGAILGGAFGAIAGEGIAEGIDPEAETTYWQNHYHHEPFYLPGHAFEDYGPAFRLGWESYRPEATFEESEETLRDKWTKDKGSSKLEWEQARDAVRAAWTRVQKPPVPRTYRL